MSGHSKWHNIQKTKGAADAKRAQAFTKIAREMIVAVKEGGSGDPRSNSRLAAVIAKAKSLVGKPYDNAFLPDNDAYYNSELLQVAFGDLFPSAPMRWRDKEGRVPQYWQEHFEKLGMPVPEGVMGTTTTSLSQSKLLRTINHY